MDILKSYIGNDIMSIVKLFLESEDWFYLNNKWGCMRDPYQYGIKYGILKLVIYGEENYMDMDDYFY